MANFQSYKRSYQEASIDRTMVPTKGTCPSNNTKEQSTHLFVKLVRKKLLACCTNRPNWKSYSKGNTVYKCSAGGAMNTLLPALKWLLEINGWSQLSRLNSADLSQSNIGVKRMSTAQYWKKLGKHIRTFLHLEFLYSPLQQLFGPLTHWTFSPITCLNQNHFLFPTCSHSDSCSHFSEHVALTTFPITTTNQVSVTNASTYALPTFINRSELNLLLYSILLQVIFQCYHHICYPLYILSPLDYYD